jgi:hypothetical protein
MLHLHRSFSCNTLPAAQADKSPHFQNEDTNEKNNSKFIYVLYYRDF